MASLAGTELCFPHLFNGSCRKTSRPYFASMLIYVTFSSISLLTTTLNLVVIISISHFKQLHTPTNLLLLSLAVSDCIVGLLVLLQIVLINGCWIFSDILCATYYVVDYTFTSASIGTMVLISVDRYVAICDPLHYSTTITETKLKISICLCWMLSLIFHTVRFKDNLKQPGRFNTCIGQCILLIDYASGLADLFLSFIIPVTVIVVLYMRVFMVVVSQAHAMRSHVTSVTIKRSVKVTAKKSEMKAAITLGVVVVVFLICVCPYFCFVIPGQDTIIDTSLFSFIITLFYFKSCLNPLIYALFYPWFRKSIKLIFTLKILQTNSCNTNIL
ncbi:trace amine-associated receptor 8a-like [Brachionichthys hirsutus]|uniref:trace amine-associated receptor 8a-like n=1 Tax=Brachionichthys hirsutus TaxID=412623 RepID=UPI0036054593